LSELLVALAIGTLVLAGSLEAFDIVQAQAVRQQRVMAAQQEMRVGEVFGMKYAYFVINHCHCQVWIDLSFPPYPRLRTTTGPVAPVKTVLPVQDGSGWEAGKTVVLCGMSG
jgi:hypothetical protein